MIGNEARAILQAAIDGYNEDADPEIVVTIWEIPLARTGSTNPTPEAFDTDSGAMLTNVVILDPDSDPHPQASSVPGAASDYLVFNYYAGDHDEGRATIAIVRALVRANFDDAEIDLPDGTCGFPIWAGDMATRRNYEEFKNSVFGDTRYRVSRA